MKQLCYLATVGEEYRFDALFEELDVVSSYYPTEKISSLTAFIMRDKTINQQDYIVCDLTSTSWSQEHILSAAQQLRRFSIARLIFIAPNEDNTALLFGKLAAQRVDDLIAVGQDTDIEDELRKCLVRSDKDKVYQRLHAMQNAMSTAASQVAAPLKIPRGMVLTVAVGGSLPRVGTTSQVFGLYHYLKKLGFIPCIFDPERRLTNVLLPFYADQVKGEDEATIIKDIPFCEARLGRYNAFVQDVGVITESTTNSLCAADIRILVGGTKPWELPALAAALGPLKDGPGEMIALISFAADGDMDTVGKYLGEHVASVPYNPNFWYPGDQTAYQEAILPCLKVICSGGGK